MTLVEKETEFEGVPVTYWEGGEGAPLLLLHGSGPGASTSGNWRLVIDDLAQRFHVIAPDLIGFGKSGRRQMQPYFDFDLWVRQAAFHLNQFGSRANILGHSLSGAIALRTAATSSRVNKVMTTGSIGAQTVANDDLKTVWSFPDTREDLIRAGKTLVFDHSLITDAYISGREKVLYANNYKEYFEAMFAGDKQLYLDAVVLSRDELSSISCDVLMLHGVDDLPTPIESTYLIARQIGHADVVALARCGHSVALEHPEKLVRIASAFFA